MHRTGATTSPARHLLRFALAAALGLPLSAQAAKFTYHGDLMDGDAPAEGAYDLRVRTFAQRGATKALGEPTELPGVNLTQGRFSVELDLPEDADGTTWVEVAVRKAESNEAYVTLGDPQPISKASACPAAWELSGNTFIPANSFLGRYDNEPLVMKVANGQALRLESVPYAGTNFVNVVAGHADNFVFPGVFAATIAGGGSDGSDANFVIGNYGTIGGGLGNAIGTIGLDGSSALYSAVGGGARNGVQASYGAIPGGFANRVLANFGFAAGAHAIVNVGHHGSFVWSEDTGADFSTSGPNQFLIRASGGVGINTATFGNAVNLREAELMIKNSPSDPNTDITLLNSTLRGYNLVSVPGAAGAAGEFYIGETDARTSTVGFSSRLRIDANGTTHTVGGVIGDLSDARLKKNLAPIADPLDTLLALRGTMFEYIDPAKAMSAPGPRMGFIAQEVQKVLPNWVHPSMDGYLSVGTIGFEALAVEAIRDLKAESDLRLEHLEAENSDLRSQLANALRRLDRLESGGVR